MNRHRSTSLFQSFNFAAEGVVHAVRTQRNLWIHFAIAIAVLIAAIGFGAADDVVPIVLVQVLARLGDDLMQIEKIARLGGRVVDGCYRGGPFLHGKANRVMGGSSTGRS